ncbi:general stress protein [Bacillus testis]|uniref:general stress protein n=1 Tax=Bacillus testis TaxID=1622072 RepID=UPI00067F1C67|nr:general stress protein [Bacillus testis]
MYKSVFGVYETGSEVKKVITALIQKGYEEDEITVVADREDRLAFTHYHPTDVNRVTNSEENETFMDKFISFFTDDETHIVEEKLESYGLSKEERDVYLRDIEHGRILVLIDDKRQRQLAYAERNVPLTTTEEYDTLGNHNPDPNLFAQRDETLENLDFDSRQELLRKSAEEELRHPHSKGQSGQHEQLSWDTDGQGLHGNRHGDQKPNTHATGSVIMTLGELHERQQRGNDPARNGIMEEQSLTENERRAAVDLTKDTNSARKE